MVVYFPLHCFSAMGFNDSTIRKMDTLLVSFVCYVFCKAKGVGRRAKGERGKVQGARGMEVRSKKLILIIREFVAY